MERHYRNYLRASGLLIQNDQMCNINMIPRYYGYHHTSIRTAQTGLVPACSVLAILLPVTQTPLLLMILVDSISFQNEILHIALCPFS